MVKDLWQFKGVTYDNSLINLEEEIDRSLSRSDKERLCKSSNGFKEIKKFFTDLLHRQYLMS